MAYWARLVLIKLFLDKAKVTLYPNYNLVSADMGTPFTWKRRVFAWKRRVKRYIVGRYYLWEGKSAGKAYRYPTIQSV